MSQPVVGRAGFNFFWLATKWARLGWLNKSSTRGGSGRVTRFDSSMDTFEYFCHL